MTEYMLLFLWPYYLQDQHGMTATAAGLILPPLCKDYYKTAEMFRNIAKDPVNDWNQLIQRYFSELNKNTQKKFLISFRVNAGMVGQSGRSILYSAVIKNVR